MEPVRADKLASSQVESSNEVFRIKKTYAFSPWQIIQREKKELQVT